MRQKQHGRRAEKEVRSEEALKWAGVSSWGGRTDGWKRSRGRSLEEKGQQGQKRRAGMIVWIKDQTWRSSQRTRVLRDEHERSAG